MRIAACLKWVDLRPEVDLVTGHVRTHVRSSGWSAADRAAVEVALRLGAVWDGTVTVVCAGPAEAEPALRELVAAGAARAVRIDAPADAESPAVASVLAEVLDGHDVVLCGDYSLDRGSGSVPAFLAHDLGAAQALGLIALDPAEAGRVLTTRRLGGGRAERLEVTAPMVLSVEGSLAQLRRAPLTNTLEALDVQVEVVPAAPSAPGTTLHGVSALRPRARVMPAPHGDHARDRILALTGALVDHVPPRTIEATPDEAADEILAQLRTWGYLP